MFAPPSLRWRRTNRKTQRINPNLLYWQRVDNAPKPETAPQTNHNETPTSDSGSSRSPSQSSSPSTTATTATFATAASNQPRPPSYASDDGIEYVVQAQPRLTISHYSPALSVEKQG
jgi:hypothetical protein